MRIVPITVALLIAGAATSVAAPRAAHPQPTATSMADMNDVGAPDSPTHATAKAQQDAFDRRIARSSERAMRSICIGCAAAAEPARKGASRQQATAVDEAEPDVAADEAYGESPQ